MKILKLAIFLSTLATAAGPEPANRPALAAQGLRVSTAAVLVETVNFADPSDSSTH